MEQNTDSKQKQTLMIETIVHDIKQIFASPEDWYKTLSMRSSLNESILLIVGSLVINIVTTAVVFIKYLSLLNSPFNAFSVEFRNAIFSSTSTSALGLVLVCLLLQVLSNLIYKREKFDQLKSAFILSAYGAFAMSIIGIFTTVFHYMAYFNLVSIIGALTSVVLLFVAGGLCSFKQERIDMKHLCITFFMLLFMTRIL